MKRARSVLAVLLLLGSAAHAQPATREQANAILQEQRSLQGILQDAADQAAFRAGQDRLNELSTRSAREGEQAAREAAARVQGASQIQGR